MSEPVSENRPPEPERPGDSDGDNAADALSAVILVLIPVVAIIYWLSGLPTS